jgi:hypothetical protein
LQEDQKEEVTDDDLFNHLNKNILENDTYTKGPPQEDNLNLDEHKIMLIQWGLLMTKLC